MRASLIDILGGTKRCNLAISSPNLVAQPPFNTPNNNAIHIYHPYPHNMHDETLWKAPLRTLTHNLVQEVTPTTLPSTNGPTTPYKSTTSQLFLRHLHHPRFSHHPKINIRKCIVHGRLLQPCALAQKIPFLIPLTTPPGGPHIHMANYNNPKLKGLPHIRHNQGLKHIQQLPFSHHRMEMPNQQ